MNSYEYIVLNTWLANADRLYLDGRLLWLQVGGIGSSCILLWLSVEQIIKTVVFQRRIQNGEFNSSNQDATHKKLDAWGMKIGHKIEKNLQALNDTYPKLLTNEEIKTLEKIYEHFNRRYVVNSSTGIAIDLLHKVDAIYFKLRDLISEDLPVAFIDEIAIRRERGQQHAIEDYMKFAYLDNSSFRKRSRYRT